MGRPGLFYIQAILVTSLFTAKVKWQGQDWAASGIASQFSLSVLFNVYEAASSESGGISRCFLWDKELIWLESWLCPFLSGSPRTISFTPLPHLSHEDTRTLITHLKESDYARCVVKSLAHCLTITEWIIELVKWTWAWANAGRWWGTERPGVLQFWGRRVGRDLMTEQQYLYSNTYSECFTQTVSFDTHNNLCNRNSYHAHCYRWDSWGMQKLSRVPKVTELALGNAEIHT